ncbi:hypothetical protein [Thiomicrorhabdus sp. Kp2]|uniref:hypothetical protein n=1 Tax=Thiomicrorhabdus sp. Kp2 TaxID=1123518 RepID=UPI000593355A|nr:hypothetical protein [Thiomicrorhabdus sp. Kp2]
MKTNVTECNLPAEFVMSTSTSKLKFKNRKKLPLHRLPFVGDEDGKLGLSFWKVPKDGGYAGGCTTGKALARIYLKHLKEHGGCPGGMLQSITLDMLDKERDDRQEWDSLKGQAVGFFSELDRWLVAAAKNMDDGLENEDNRVLLKTANKGLNFDAAAYRASLKD